MIMVIYIMRIFSLGFPKTNYKSEGLASATPEEFYEENMASVHLFVAVESLRYQGYDWLIL